MHASRIALVVASVVGMICTFLPWVNVPFIGSVYGTRGDGWITFAVCAGASVCMLVEDRRSPLTLWAILVSALCGITASTVAVWDIVRVNDTLADNALGAAVSIGPGLYLLVAAGAVMAFLPAILSLRRPPVPQQRITTRVYWPPNG
jgi:hypothetical protein